MNERTNERNQQRKETLRYCEDIVTATWWHIHQIQTIPPLCDKRKETLACNHHDFFRLFSSSIYVYIRIMWRTICILHKHIMKHDRWVGYNIHAFKNTHTHLKKWIGSQSVIAGNSQSTFSHLWPLSGCIVSGSLINRKCGRRALKRTELTHPCTSGRGPLFNYFTTTSPWRRHPWLGLPSLKTLKRLLMFCFLLYVCDVAYYRKKEILAIYISL